MHILLSNDDGYQAPGIQALYERLTKQHRVTLVAPDQDRSGASNSLTLDRPLQAQAIAKDIFKVNGTPTDCVHLAITGLLDREPDIVVSGINAGPNLGDDVLYSGTVAAAMEGRFLGFPALAVSSVSSMPNDLQADADLVFRLLQRFQKHPPQASMVLNVNIPNQPSRSLGDIEVTRLGSRHKAEPIIQSLNPRGERVYWVGPPGPEQDAGQGTDFYAMQNHVVSMTPLYFDLTHHAAIPEVVQWIQKNDY